MGLSTERSQWGAGQVDGFGIPPGTRLAVTSNGFGLMSYRWTDRSADVGSCDFYRSLYSGPEDGFDCRLAAAPNGGAVTVVSLDGALTSVGSSTPGSLVQVDVFGYLPGFDGPLQTLTEAQLTEIATDPGLRWCGIRLWETLRP